MTGKCIRNLHCRWYIPFPEGIEKFIPCSVVFRAYEDYVFYILVPSTFAKVAIDYPYSIEVGICNVMV